MPAVVDAAASHGMFSECVPGLPAGTSELQDIAGAVEDVRPPAEEVGQRRLLEPLDEDDVGMSLDADVSGIQRRDSARAARWRRSP